MTPLQKQPPARRFDIEFPEHQLRPIGNARPPMRYWWRRVERGLTLAVALAAALALACVVWHEMVNDQPPVTPVALKFETDERLTAEWLVQYLGSGENTCSDIAAIERKLLRHGQIASVAIHKTQGGKGLSVRVREREPIMRWREPRPGGGFNVRMVAGDGTVYEGVNYAPAFCEKLPWLVDATPVPSDSGDYLTVPGMWPVGEFVALARAHLPSLVQDWESISLRHFRAGTLQPSGTRLIRVRLRQSPPLRRHQVRELIFSADGRDFHEELFNIYGNKEVREAVRKVVRQNPGIVYDWDMAFKNKTDPNPVHEPRLTEAGRSNY